ncbi:MAG: hypothetical protein EHM58_04545 [Ignavibacteriae bacterium]|nr:MAG: hypothetical protein EHM58_04545 [Ignavibacteriota bacterium]
MKKNISYLVLILFAWFFINPLFVKAVDIVVNYSSQQIDNMVFNSSDSTISVNLKTVDTLDVNITSTGGSYLGIFPAVDTAAYFVSDSLRTTNDTINLTSHFNVRFKFSVTCTERITAKLIGLDTLYIPANGSLSMDYLSITKYNKMVFFPISGTVNYSFASQGY